MDATDQLALIAELGIGFAGFLAIFLIFARREGRFSPADSIRVRAIVAASFSSIFMALLPLLLTLTELDESTVWRLSSAIFLAVMIALGVSIGRTQVALAPDERAEVGFLNNLVAWGLVFLGAMLLAANAVGAFGAPSALPYLAALVFNLGVATSNFVTIAVQRLL